MSADPTQLFLESGGAGAAPAAHGDPTQAFLESGGSTSANANRDQDPYWQKAAHSLLGEAELGGAAIGNILPNAGNAAIDLASRATGFGPRKNVIPTIPVGAAGKDFANDVGEIMPKGDTVADQTQAIRNARLGKPNATVADVIKQTGDVAGDVGDIAAAAVPGIKATNWVRTPGAPFIEQGHPLTQAAEGEVADMKAHADAATQAGLDLPPREVSPAQNYVNNAARRDLALPGNAPVTSGLLDAARSQYVSPAYDAAKKVPAYDLSDNYKEAMGKVDLEKIDPSMRPPVDGQMTGAQAVQFSQNLRHEASAWYDYAEGAGGPTAKATAKAYAGAYKAVEGGFREGAPDSIADAWDKARTYAAKTYAWDDTLDGAGNAAGPKIKKLLLQGDPISGPMKEAASVVAQYPELFKSTRLQTPGEGVMKRTVRAVAPVAGAAIGTALVPGPMGAAGGTALGELMSEKFLGPRR